MTIHRANCEDCPWAEEGEDLVELSDEMERHARKEQHDCDLQRAVATDGGTTGTASGGHDETDRVNVRMPESMIETIDDAVDRGVYVNRSEAIRDACRQRFIASDGGQDLPEKSGWSFAAVVHGADVDADCLALTGSGKPCSYNAYLSNEGPVCNTHADANDPEIVETAHQWARISDGQSDPVTVCVNCEEVWHGNEPETAVACPECSADVGQRCKDESSSYAAPIPPHPGRRRRAYETIQELDPCRSNPSLEDDVQEPLITDGGSERHDPRCDCRSCVLSEDQASQMRIDRNRELRSDGGFRQGDRVKVLEDSNSPKAGETGDVRRQKGDYVVVDFDDGDAVGHYAGELVLEKQVRTDGGQHQMRQQQRQAQKLQLQHAAEQSREQRLETALNTGLAEKQGQRIWIIPEFEPDEAEAEYIQESVREALPEYNCELAVDRTEPMTKDRIYRMLAGSDTDSGEDEEVRTDGGHVLNDGMHYCEICDREFLTIEELIEHDCDDDRDYVGVSHS